MRISPRAALGLALAAGLTMAGLSPIRAATPIEKTLPATTLGFLKIEDAAKLRDSFWASQAGRLLSDPAMKPMMDRVEQLLEKPNQKLKQAVGVTIPELLKLPTGQVAIAVASSDDPKVPFSVVVSADAGANDATMTEVMAGASKEAEKQGAKVATEKFQGTELHVIQPTDEDAPPLVWAKQGTVFRIGSNLAAVKDLLSHAEGRDDSLASNEFHGEVMKRVTNKSTQVRWFLDIAQAKSTALKAATENGGNGEAIETQLQILGLNSIKALGGSFSFSEGEYDSISKMFLYSPGESTGILKIFQMPAVNLQPPAWVPASVASYQSFSWDLDAAWEAINDLASQFAPGVINNVEQQIGGLSFKDDLFGPLGDRITLISDFKKPVNEKSQRLLLAISLDDSKAFQNTLNKIFDLAKASPEKRTFQGATIYDFDVPEALSQNGINGPVSLAIAKEHLFVSSEPAILEQILRSGGPSLADSATYQKLTKHYPATASTLSFQKPEEQARLLYNMVKSGQLQQAIKQAGANDPNAPDVDEILDPKLLPDFSVFEKYLSPGGGFGVMTPDGVMFTQFTIRKAQP